MCGHPATNILAKETPAGKDVWHKEGACGASQGSSPGAPHWQGRQGEQPGIQKAAETALTREVSDQQCGLKAQALLNQEKWEGVPGGSLAQGSTSMPR